MCGFAGLWDSSGGDFTDTLLSMGKAIAHRGPDSGDLWCDTEIGFGLAHQRLAVVDLTPAGAQPMATPDGRYIIAFNGEIYNHLTIRAEIEASQGPHNWRGTSDTETLLIAVATFGLVPTVNKLVGMFAFAIWDRQNRALSLVRDRFGEKPLYYGRQSGKFVFGSELKSIEAIPDLELEVDHDALSLYFRHNYIPAPYSIYKGIAKLEPGCMLTLQASNAKPVHLCYWSAVKKAEQQMTQPFQGSLDDATDAVESKLCEAIQGQMIADVPVGAFLSGGIDSSTVVALMQNVTSTKVNSFSIGFEDKQLNEAQHAKIVAASLNTEHTELYLSNTDIEQLVQTLPALTDEPFADSSLLPTHAVSKLARKSVTVSLSGDGGDELFGGYTRFLTAAKVMDLRKRSTTVGSVSAAVIANSPLMKNSASGTPVWRLNALQNSGAGFQSSMLIHLLSQESDALAYRELLSFWRNPDTPVLNPTTPITYFHDEARWLNNEHTQEAIKMMDVQTYLPDDILTKVDRAAMNVSLETRVPMLDHRFAELVWSLPSEYRTHTNKSTPKRILRTIAAQYVPLEQLDRPKMGFGVPLEKWLRGPLRLWAESLIEPAAIKQQGILDESIVTATWQNVLSGQPRATELMWSILMFQHWLQHSPVGIRSSGR